MTYHPPKHQDHSWIHFDELLPTDTFFYLIQSSRASHCSVSDQKVALTNTNTTSKSDNSSLLEIVKQHGFHEYLTLDSIASLRIHLEQHPSVLEFVIINKKLTAGEAEDLLDLVNGSKSNQSIFPIIFTLPNHYLVTDSSNQKIHAIHSPLFMIPSCWDRIIILEILTLVRIYLWKYRNPEPDSTICFDNIISSIVKNFTVRLDNRSQDLSRVKERNIGYQANCLAYKWLDTYHRHSVQETKQRLLLSERKRRLQNDVFYRLHQKARNASAKVDTNVKS